MKRRERAVSPEDRWLTDLKTDLLRASTKVAAVIKGSMRAQRMGIGKNGEAVRLGPDHRVRLKGAALAMEVFTPRARGKTDRDARPILNIQAGARVQLVFFGKAIDALPEREAVPDHSPELKAVLVRAGKILPGAGVPETAKATEATKALPEGKAQGEGFLR